MVSFEIFVKSMPPSLSELKVLPSFCFAFKIPDDVAASNPYVHQKCSLERNSYVQFIDFSILQESQICQIEELNHQQLQVLQIWDQNCQEVAMAKLVGAVDDKR